MTQYGLQFSHKAAREIDHIEAFLAAASYPRIAEEFVTRLYARCRTLCEAPLHGHNLDGTRKGFRTVGFEGCASIGYEIVGDTVRILSISYRGRRMNEDTRSAS